MIQVAPELAALESLLTTEERHAWRLPERRTPSEWANECRVLSSRESAEPGPWSNPRTPYLVEIMDAAAPDPQRANYLFFLKPVIAAFLAVFLLGDALTGLQALAIFAICFCVALEYVWTQRLAARAVA